MASWNLSQLKSIYDYEKTPCVINAKHEKEAEMKS